MGVVLSTRDTWWEHNGTYYLSWWSMVQSVVVNPPLRPLWWLLEHLGRYGAELPNGYVLWFVSRRGAERIVEFDAGREPEWRSKLVTRRGARA